MYNTHGTRSHSPPLLKNQPSSVTDAFALCAENQQPALDRAYQLPLVMDFLKEMNASGHTASYYQWFEAQKKQAPNLDK